MLPLPADYRERQYISQYATDVLGLVIHKDGVPGDADLGVEDPQNPGVFGSGVFLSLVQEDAPDPADASKTAPRTVFTREVDHVAVGTYETALDASESALVGLYTLVWTYTIDGADQTYQTYAMIGQSSPEYDSLAPAMKDIVDSVWIRVADLFDHPTGGPHLQTYFQTHFGRGRVAQLMQIAVGRLNTAAQPFSTYTINDGQGGGTFPVDSWGPLLETATWVESLKHLVRSYVEQPNFMGSGAVSRLDRRDYMQRWQEVLYGGPNGGEEGMLAKQLETFKIANMGLGRPAVLVSGGVYGRYGPTRVAGSVAARPRYWTRWY